MHRTVRSLLCTALALAAAPLAADTWVFDPAFNELDTPGRVIYEAGSGGDWATDLLIDPQGRLLVAVTAQFADVTSVTVRRYALDGTPDASFGVGGVYTALEGGAPDFPVRLALDPATGAIYLGFSARLDARPDWDFYVEKITPAGAWDAYVFTNFDVFPVEHDDFLDDLDFDGGRLVAVGAVERSAPGDFDIGVAAFDAQLARDTTFDGDGLRVLFFDLGGSDYDAPATVIVEGAATTIFGSAATDAGWDGFALRLDATGTPDASFGTGGFETYRFVSVFTPATTTNFAAAARHLGGYVVVGHTTHPTQPFATQDMLVARIGASGALDLSFGIDGFRLVDFVFPLSSSGSDRADCVAVDPTGRIVVGGTNRSPTQPSLGYAALTRLDAGGELDPNFHAGGSRLLAQPLALPRAHGVVGLALAPEARVALAGWGDHDLGATGAEGFVGMLRAFEIFADDFESGGSDRWSATTP